MNYNTTFNVTIREQFKKNTEGNNRDFIDQTGVPNEVVQLFLTTGLVKDRFHADLIRDYCNDPK